MKATLVRRALLSQLFLSLLAACSGSLPFKEGNALLDAGQIGPGLAKLEQATRDDPHNAEYRIALLSRKFKLVSAFNNRADLLRAQGQVAEADASYDQALAIEPANQVARQGKAALEQDRRAQQVASDVAIRLQRGDDTSLEQAQELLRPWLAQQPGSQVFQRLASQVSEAQARLHPVSNRLAAAYRKPVTLEFRDAPLRTVFDFLSKVSGLNFVFDRDVDPALRTSISVHDTSIAEAIIMLLGANQLEQSISGERSVTIYPNTAQKQKDYQQLLVRSFFLANADVKTVAFSLKTLLKARDLVTDERIGSIIMRDTPEMIRMAERIIAVQDLADPEVMLEVEVLEVKRSRIQELGVRWPDSVGLTLLGGGQYGALHVSDLRKINGDQIGLALGSVTLNASQNNTDSNILANPRIRVRNRDKAKVLIGDRVPVITVTTNNGVSADSVNYVDVGLKLEVEPNVYLDDEVAIKINLEVSSVVKEIISKSGTQAYQIGTRSAATVLRLKDGETQVLAGLISDEDRSSANKIPGVGELPVLNRLFGSRKDDSTRSEIVLSITPRVLRAIRRPPLSVAEFNAGTESDIGGGSLPAIALNSALHPHEEPLSTKASDMMGSDPPLGKAAPQPPALPTPSQGK